MTIGSEGAGCGANAQTKRAFVTRRRLSVEDLLFARRPKEGGFHSRFKKPTGSGKTNSRLCFRSNAVRPRDPSRMNPRSHPGSHPTGSGFGQDKAAAFCGDARTRRQDSADFHHRVSGESFMDMRGGIVLNWVRAEVVLLSPIHYRASVCVCNLSQLAEIPADRRDTRDPIQAVLDNCEFLSQHGRRGVPSHSAATTRTGTERELFRFPGSPFQPYTESAISPPHKASARDA